MWVLRADTAALWIDGKTVSEAGVIEGLERREVSVYCDLDLLSFSGNGRGFLLSSEKLQVD